MKITKNDFVKALEIEIRREEFDFKDLMNDFEFVKELNKELSLKYQDFVDALPKPAEIDIIIGNIHIELNQLNADVEKDRINYLKKRLFQLNRFKSAAIILEKQDPENKPMSYEKLFGNGA